MIKSATLILPWPPTINSYKSVGSLNRTKSGKLYQTRHNSTATLVFYSKVAWEIHEEGMVGMFKADSTLYMGLELYPPDKRRSDIDNRIKVTLDALQRGKLFPDDYQIARLLVERKDIISGGQVVVRISEIEK